MSVCISGEAVRFGNGLTRPESCFPIRVYHSLPYLTPPLLNPLVFLVWSTNCYQPPDLSVDLPCATFTNHYHREQGLGIDVSVAGIQHQVAGWCRVITVDNGRHSQKAIDTMVVGIRKIFQIQKGRSVSRLKPMVADLVGQ